MENLGEFESDRLNLDIIAHTCGRDTKLEGEHQAGLVPRISGGKDSKSPDRVWHWHLSKSHSGPRRTPVV